MEPTWGSLGHPEQLKLGSETTSRQETTRRRPRAIAEGLVKAGLTLEAHRGKGFCRLSYGVWILSWKLQECLKAFQQGSSMARLVLQKAHTVIHQVWIWGKDQEAWRPGKSPWEVARERGEQVHWDHCHQGRENWKECRVIKGSKIQKQHKEESRITATSL